MSTTLDILVAERDSTAPTAFSAATEPAGLNGNRNDFRAWLSPDELTVVFASDSSGGEGGADLWTATLSAASASFSSPTNLSRVNGSSSDDSPTLSDDGLTLYFASDRSGGLGAKDVWTATRTSASSDFGTPLDVEVLSGKGLDADLALSHDRRELFLASTRGGGTPRLWRAIRECR